MSESKDQSQPIDLQLALKEAVELVKSLQGPMPSDMRGCHARMKNFIKKYEPVIGA